MFIHFIRGSRVGGSAGIIGVCGECIIRIPNHRPYAFSAKV